VQGNFRSVSGRKRVLAAPGPPFFSGAPLPPVFPSRQSAPGPLAAPENTRAEEKEPCVGPGNTRVLWNKRAPTWRNTRVQRRNTPVQAESRAPKRGNTRVGGNSTGAFLKKRAPRRPNPRAVWKRRAPSRKNTRVHRLNSRPFQGWAVQKAWNTMVQEALPVAGECAGKPRRSGAAAHC
jgi:hypothetical protein